MFNGPRVNTKVCNETNLRYGLSKLWNSGVKCTYHGVADLHSPGRVYGTRRTEQRSAASGRTPVHTRSLNNSARDTPDACSTAV